MGFLGQTRKAVERGKIDPDLTEKLFVSRISELRASRNFSQKSVIHSMYGSVLYATNRYDEAEKQFREVIALEPNDSDANFCLASILFQRKEISEAQKYYARAIAQGFEPVSFEDIIVNQTLKIAFNALASD